VPDAPVPHATVLGCRVDALDRQGAVERIVELLRHPGWYSVVTLGTEMVVRAQRDAQFRELINESALSLCDTIGVLWAARLQGVRIPERVSGIDLIDPLCEALAREKIPVYLVGGKGDTAARAATALVLRHPGLIVAGTRDGYYPAIVPLLEEMRGSGARVILVGLGSPRQETWIRMYLPYSGADVGIGVGGSFDVIAGNVQRAPESWRRLNLEWLYRLFKEPQRWRRQLALPVFVFLWLRDRLSGGRAAA
jgi:N-acetylglucosaminyldiphosphoundecaprenol N-acetyl-beta-D-mannosaminyltransferase